MTEKKETSDKCLDKFKALNEIAAQFNRIDSIVKIRVEERYNEGYVARFFMDLNINDRFLESARYRGEDKHCLAPIHLKTSCMDYVQVLAKERGLRIMYNNTGESFWLIK